MRLELGLSFTLQSIYGLSSLTWAGFSAFLGLNTAQKHVATKQNGKHWTRFNSISLHRVGSLLSLNSM